MKNESYGFAEEQNRPIGGKIRFRGTQKQFDITQKQFPTVGNCFCVPIGIN